MQIFLIEKYLCLVLIQVKYIFIWSDVILSIKTNINIFLLQHIGFKGDVLWISVFRCYTQMFLTMLNRGEYAIEFGVIAENSV